MEHGVRGLVRHALADHAGGLCWLAATTVPPVLVLERCGAAAGAHFSLAWVIAGTLNLISLNMGASLTVEAVAAGRSTGALAERCRRVVTHTGTLLAVGGVLLFAGAPYVLRVFGDAYARSGTTPLRLLVVAAAPYLIVATAISACRALGRMALAGGVQAAVAATSLTLTVVLLPGHGVPGAAAAWLITQTAAAALLLVNRRAWLPDGPLGPCPPGRARHRRGRGRPGGVRGHARAHPSAHTRSAGHPAAPVRGPRGPSYRFAPAADRLLARAASSVRPGSGGNANGRGNGSGEDEGLPAGPARPTTPEGTP